MHARRCTCWRHPRARLPKRGPGAGRAATTNGMIRSLYLLGEPSSVTESAPDPIRVLVADDHWVVRQGLRLFLDRDARFAVVGEAEDGAAAVRLATELRPNVVLMDLLMPVLDGVAATEAIRREAPGVEVVALTSVLDEGKVVEA